MRSKFFAFLLSLVMLVSTAHGAIAGKPNGGGGGSSTPSPFAPAGFANVSTFSSWYDLAVSPDGAYVYVDGVLASNSHGAIAKVKIADGTIAATVDLGAGVSPQGIAVLPDSAHLYAYDRTAGLTGWYVTTSSMAIARTDTLSAAVATASSQQFDLSPDGTKYAYVSANNTDHVYEIATATGAVTTVTVGHSDGGTHGASAVCWYNGSSVNFYVAYNQSASVDLYSAGTYTSTVATGAGGTPAFNAMRSGINGNFYIADSGTNKELIMVKSSTPTLVPVSVAIINIATNSLSEIAATWGYDICFLQDADGRFYATAQAFSNNSILPIAVTSTAAIDGADSVDTGLAVAPDASGTLYSLGGTNFPTVWSLPSLMTNPVPAAAGNIQTSDGLGNWTSQAGPPMGAYGSINGGTTSLSFGVGTQCYAVEGTATVNLPDPTVSPWNTMPSPSYRFKNIGTGTITFQVSGSGNQIDGANTFTSSTKWQMVEFQNIGGAWTVVNSYVP